jgi:hypothetical protein
MVSDAVSDFAIRDFQNQFAIALNQFQVERTLRACRATLVRIS